MEELSSRKNGLRKQVTEAKERPSELKREKSKGNGPGRVEEGERKGASMLSGRREPRLLKCPGKCIAWHDVIATQFVIHVKI